MAAPGRQVRLWNVRWLVFAAVTVVLMGLLLSTTRLLTAARALLHGAYYPVAPASEDVAALMHLFRGAPYAFLYHVTSERTRRYTFPAEDRPESPRYHAPGDYYAFLQAVLEAEVQHALAPGEALYFVMWLDDHDFWNNADLARAAELRAFTAAHPHVFFFAWNPTLIDPHRGFIGPNVIPIPDIYHFVPMYTGARPTPCSEKDPEVFWRGATTGEPLGPRYLYDSDRGRTVAAFSNATFADVKFDNVVQGAGVPIGLQAAVPKPHDESAGLAYTDGVVARSARARVQLDVDGNANSWSLRHRLAAGAAVVKIHSPRYVQWYYPLLEHGRHLLVAPVGGAVAAAERLVNDVVVCNAMQWEALLFYTALLSAQSATGAQAQNGVALGFHGILRDFRAYTRPRDWRINGTAHLFDDGLRWWPDVSVP